MIMLNNLINDFFIIFYATSLLGKIGMLALLATLFFIVGLTFAIFLIAIFADNSKF